MTLGPGGVSEVHGYGTLSAYERTSRQPPPDLIAQAEPRIAFAAGDWGPRRAQAAHRRSSCGAAMASSGEIGRRAAARYASPKATFSS